MKSYLVTRTSQKIDLDQGQVFSIGYDEMGAIQNLS